MFRRVAMWCAIAAFTFAGLPPAMAAGNTITYDTVDAVEVLADRISVTGIISGQGTPSTREYTIFSSSSTTGATDVAASRCDRLALLAMSKPGKFQFAVTLLTGTGAFSCTLIVRAP